MGAGLVQGGRQIFVVATDGGSLGGLPVVVVVFSKECAVSKVSTSSLTIYLQLCMAVRLVAIAARHLALRARWHHLPYRSRQRWSVP